MPDPLPTHAGPFALGTFASGASGEAGFPGLVTGDRVRDLSDLVPSIRALVEDWAAGCPDSTTWPGPPRGPGTSRPHCAS